MLLPSEYEVLKRIYDMLDFVDLNKEIWNSAISEAVNVASCHEHDSCQDTGVCGCRIASQLEKLKR